MNVNLFEILYLLIKEHMESAEPVGSNILVKKYNLSISSATARQRLVELETLNYIKQPHISAGRIPTEKAYKLFVEKLIKEKNQFKVGSVKIKKTEDEQKNIAKSLAHNSNLAIFWAFNKKNLYYTGISNLLRQPEFSQINRVYDISQVIDDIDEIIDESFNKILLGEHILIGSSNPFGSFCSSIVCKYKGVVGEGMFGVIGPMRMDYDKIIELTRLTYKKLI